MRFLKEDKKAKSKSQKPVAATPAVVKSEPKPDPAPLATLFLLLLDVTVNFK